MAKLRLTVACGDYDIVRAFKEGAVQADGLDLVFLTEMGPRERHWRMGRKHEFDEVAERHAGRWRHPGNDLADLAKAVRTGGQAHRPAVRRLQECRDRLF